MIGNQIQNLFVGCFGETLMLSFEELNKFEYSYWIVIDSAEGIPTYRKTFVLPRQMFVCLFTTKFIGSLFCGDFNPNQGKQRNFT